MKPTKTWKTIERKIGEMLGLPAGKQRVGARGDSSFDVTAPIRVNGRPLGVEVKYRLRIPQCLYDWMNQAEGHNETASEPHDPIVVAVGYRKSKRDFMAIMPFEHYIELRRVAEDPPAPPVERRFRDVKTGEEAVLYPRVGSVEEWG